MKINWKRYFDQIYLISYTKNVEHRAIAEAELKRIGVESYQVKYSVDNKLLDNLKESFNSMDIKKHALYVTNTHYETIKEAYDLGYERILILEDDVVFLNDISKIKDELDYALASNADISMYDYVEYDTSHIEYDAWLCQLSSAYSLDRRGMEYMFKNIESNFSVIDFYFTNCVQTITNKLTGEVSYINIGNILGFEPSHTVPQTNRICIQSKIIDGKLQYDKGIYYDAAVINKNRIDTPIDEVTAYSSYNFKQYM